jgi:DNA-binding NarL/FixJ family response regulator
VTTRVVIVDDQAVVRAGFATILGAEDDLEVVGEAGDGEEALRVVARTEPDVVVMDVRMPVLDGVTTTARMTASGATAAVLIVTTFDLDEYVFSALRAGAAGFVLKDIEPDDLVAAVRTLAAGQGLVAPQVTRRLIAEFGRRPAPSPPPAAVTGLTPRERDILDRVALGRSNAEIAEELVVSVSTVKTHVSGLLDKLACRDRVQLVVLAHRHGLVAPS